MTGTYIERRGRKLTAACAPYHRAGCIPAVYLIDGGGIVKVGHSRSVTGRLLTLHSQFARSGHPIRRFHIFPTGNRNAWSAEIACIRVLRAEGVPLPNRIEYFAGLPFERAVALVRQTLECDGYAVAAAPLPTPEARAA